MKQRCPQCEAWSSEDATTCSCGYQFVRPGFARIHRQPPPTVDPSLVNDLLLRSRRDIRNGIVLIGVLLPVTVVVLALGGRLGIVPVGGLFWSGILIIRGFRLRREARDAEMAGR